MAKLRYDEHLHVFSFLVAISGIAQCFFFPEVYRRPYHVTRETSPVSYERETVFFSTNRRAQLGKWLTTVAGSLSNTLTVPRCWKQRASCKAVNGNTLPISVRKQSIIILLFLQKVTYLR